MTLYAFQRKIGRGQSRKWTFDETSQDYLDEYLPELVDRNVQVRMMGSKDNLPKHTQDALEKLFPRRKTMMD